MNSKTILAIETSCDDTSVAILKKNRIVSNIIISSSDIQNKYGGVVPEVAAREHSKNIIKILKQVVNEFDLKDIDIIAYTSEPGLRVSLNVGEALATSLATILNKPLVPINHIYAHIFSFYEKGMNIEYPMLSLVASGGHTSIFLVNNATSITLLNETRDDAVGEVFDKIARSLNLGYPGGPIIDSMFDIKMNKINFSSYQKNDEPFSFSGLKTKVLNYINENKMKKQELNVVEIISSFQYEAISMMINKVKYYLDKYKINSICIGGGVSANNYLQEQIKLLNVKNIYIPKSKILCGDNAAMIAIYASLLI